MNKRRNWYEQKVDDTCKALHDMMLSSWVQKYWEEKNDSCTILNISDSLR